jgi:hypothetical protein
MMFFLGTFQSSNARVDNDSPGARELPQTEVRPEEASRYALGGTLRLIALSCRRRPRSSWCPFSARR